MTSVQGVEVSVMLPSGSNHLLLSVFLAENCSNMSHSFCRQVFSRNESWAEIIRCNIYVMMMSRAVSFYSVCINLNWFWSFIVSRKVRLRLPGTLCHKSLLHDKNWSKKLEYEVTYAKPVQLSTIVEFTSCEEQFKHYAACMDACL